MSRSKNYVRNEALEKARDSFWEHGYDAIGVRALERHTGLNRFAIQTDFGGKEGLFLEALDKYAEDSIEAIMNPIKEGQLDAIKQFFIDSVTPHDDDNRVFGCLMVNTVIENASPGRDKIKMRTDTHYQTMQSAFETALLNTRHAGELREEVDPKEAASFLLGLAMGMQVYIRMKGSILAATHQTDIALTVLDSWRRS